MLELGWAGLLLKLGLVGWLLLLAARRARDSNTDPYWRFFALAFAGMSVVILSNFWLILVWGADAAGFLYWLFAGILVASDRRRDCQMSLGPKQC